MSQTLTTKITRVFTEFDGDIEMVWIDGPNLIIPKSLFTEHNSDPNDVVSRSCVLELNDRNDVKKFSVPSLNLTITLIP